MPERSLPPLRRNEQFSQQRIADSLYTIRAVHYHIVTLKNVFISDASVFGVIDQQLTDLRRALLHELGEQREIDLIDGARKRHHA